MGTPLNKAYEVERPLAGYADSKSIGEHGPNTLGMKAGF